MPRVLTDPVTEGHGREQDQFDDDDMQTERARTLCPSPGHLHGCVTCAAEDGRLLCHDCRVTPRARMTPSLRATTVGAVSMARVLFADVAEDADGHLIAQTSQSVKSSLTK